MLSARVQNFKPSVNGFAFANSFSQGIPDLTITLPPPFNTTIPIGDASNGVCGGMVYAVLDFFLAQPRLHIPTNTAPPGKNDPLTVYITHRLIDSFALLSFPSNVSRYLDFMSTLDHDTWIAHGVPWDIVHQEWPKIKADIDAGRPSPLGLVSGAWVWPTNIAAKIDMLQHCHQVLAYGYDLDDANTLTLHVYDPNDPKDDNSVISLNIGNPTHTTAIHTPQITQHIAGHVSFRAFFRHNFYTPVTPPAGLSPGIFVLNTNIQPATIPVGKSVTVTVTAHDVSTGQAVSGDVRVNGVKVGTTGTPFAHVYQASWIRHRAFDPVTHRPDPIWHWVGPHYPLMQVSAPSYATVTLPAHFSGGTPPPSGPAI